jgi:hypothetical protein
LINILYTDGKGGIEYKRGGRIILCVTEKGDEA